MRRFLRARRGTDSAPAWVPQPPSPSSPSRTPRVTPSRAISPGALSRSWSRSWRGFPRWRSSTTRPPRRSALPLRPSWERRTIFVGACAGWGNASGFTPSWSRPRAGDRSGPSASTCRPTGSSPCRTRSWPGWPPRCGRRSTPSGSGAPGASRSPASTCTTAGSGGWTTSDEGHWRMTSGRGPSSSALSPSIRIRPALMPACRSLTSTSGAVSCGSAGRRRSSARSSMLRAPPRSMTVTR
jgi:hypothetical protein